MNVNLDIYKSKNNFMIKKLYAGLFGDEEHSLDDNEMKGVSQEEIREMENRIMQNVMNEVLKVLLGLVVGNSQNISNTVQQNKSDLHKNIDEDVASAAIGYFEE